jgi:hypothetical protein
MMDNEARKQIENMKIKSFFEYQFAKKSVTVIAQEVPEEKVKEDFERFKEQIKGQAMLRKRNIQNE